MRRVSASKRNHCCATGMVARERHSRVVNSGEVLAMGQRLESKTKAVLSVAAQENRCDSTDPKQWRKYLEHCSSDSWIRGVADSNTFGLRGHRVAVQALQHLHFFLSVHFFVSLRFSADLSRRTLSCRPMAISARPRRKGSGRLDAVHGPTTSSCCAASRSFCTDAVRSTAIYVIAEKVLNWTWQNWTLRASP
jgi:hypothetical protein